jgi:hypothetical protein
MKSYLKSNRYHIVKHTLIMGKKKENSSMGHIRWLVNLPIQTGDDGLWLNVGHTNGGQWLVF